MLLDVLPLGGGGARLIRVYGEQPCVCVPASLPAPDGSKMNITELGDYCFSEKPRSVPAPDALCRCEVNEAGEARLISAFGRVCATYHTQEEPHAVCGNFVEELTLPDSLRVIGSCSFYNCRRLRALSFGSGGLVIGSDVFLNCFALETLIIRAKPDEPTGLFALVNNITEAVRAVFQPRGAAAPIAGLWYPAYWEDIEETPAHILLHTFSGQGYHYRQCFSSNVLLCAEYDAVFPQGHDADDPDTMAMLCFERLRWPWHLGESAAAAYREFLAANTGRVLKRLLKAQDIDAVRTLISLDVLNEASFAEAAALASGAECAQAAALLAEAQHARFAAKPKKARYDFDF